MWMADLILWLIHHFKRLDLSTYAHHQYLMLKPLIAIAGSDSTYCCVFVENVGSWTPVYHHLKSLYDRLTLNLDCFENVLDLPSLLWHSSTIKIGFPSCPLGRTSWDLMKVLPSAWNRRQVWLSFCSILYRHASKSMSLLTLSILYRGLSWLFPSSMSSSLCDYVRGQLKSQPYKRCYWDFC